MDAAHVLQTVLSVMQADAPQPAATPFNATCAQSGSQLPPPVAAAPMTVPQMFMAIFSMAAVQDWAKLLLVGAFLEACRRGSAGAWEKLVDYFWVTADFEWDGDGSGESESESGYCSAPTCTAMLTTLVGLGLQNG